MSIYTAWHFSRVNRIVLVRKIEIEVQPVAQRSVYLLLSGCVPGESGAARSKAKRSEVSGQRLGVSRPS